MPWAVAPLQNGTVAPYVAIAPKPPRGLAIASLVLGIIGATFAFVPIFNVVPLIGASVGLILGGVALRERRPGRTMALWGIWLSVAAWVPTWVFWIILAINAAQSSGAATSY